MQSRQIIKLCAIKNLSFGFWSFKIREVRDFNLKFMNIFLRKLCIVVSFESTE